MAFASTRIAELRGEHVGARRDRRRRRHGRPPVPGSDERAGGHESRRDPRTSSSRSASAGRKPAPGRDLGPRRRPPSAADRAGSRASLRYPPASAAASPAHASAAHPKPIARARRLTEPGPRCPAALADRPPTRGSTAATPRACHRPRRSATPAGGPADANGSSSVAVVPVGPVPHEEAPPVLGGHRRDDPEAVPVTRVARRRRRRAAPRRCRRPRSAPRPRTQEASTRIRRPPWRIALWIRLSSACASRSGSAMTTAEPARQRRTSDRLAAAAIPRQRSTAGWTRARQTTGRGSKRRQPPLISASRSPSAASATRIACDPGSARRPRRRERATGAVDAARAAPG